ncbi:unnamed protein product [Ostreobium quekettii]|uniref:AAA+ ATPase domain-containing protein n=1 Tax=Ostreobium quekettii TaxID=121088 RepID=A0A8S1IV70_9CHLO|nr:unnamed protein product [Ostreobium quekettii]
MQNAVYCSLREHRRSVTVLLCGTSGTGKSTLASLLANRLGITTVISTDSVRSMLRSFNDSRLLAASTYEAGDYFDAERTIGLEGLSDSQRAVKGYKAQSEMVMEHLGRLIAECEGRNESLLCEGVHLSLNFVIRLMRSHPSIVPILVYISNEEKHRERFAVRSKYMAMDPAKNRYVKYLKNIRVIQDFLIRKADKHLIPKVDNTNVDRSIAIIHACMFGCVKRMAKGEKMLDAATNTAKAVNAEFSAVKDTMAWRGKAMLELIRQKAMPDFPCDPSTSSGPSMFSSDGGEDTSEASFVELPRLTSERVMSSDPEDDIASYWEDSSDNEKAGMPEAYAECGSVWESTDLEEHEDEDEDGWGPVALPGGARSCTDGDWGP